MVVADVPLVASRAHLIDGRRVFDGPLPNVDVRHAPRHTMAMKFERAAVAAPIRS